MACRRTDGQSVGHEFTLFLVQRTQIDERIPVSKEATALSKQASLMLESLVTAN